MNDVCSVELLTNAVANRLSEDEEAALYEHLERCEACCARMEQLAGGEQWQQEAASLLTTDELDAAVPEPMVWSEVDFSVEHLEPSEDANVLGQLGGYDVLAIIGRGGMGVVLKAFDRELKRFVAIKALSPHLAHSSVARKRFAREAQAAAAVVNPHVIAIHHVQPTGRLPFLIMPLLTGESLAQRLKSRAPLELTEVLRIGMQAAVGLAAAHDQGLVHRDVKPANIFLEKGVERVVITDFGLARAADDVSMTRLGVVAGTPEYMSPEQARGEALDGRSDLFSLGCVLYEMATGVSPFRSDSTIATLRRIVDDKPAAIASLAPELPPWFCHIVGRLLSKDPVQRFASASEVSQLLEQCLSHLQQPTSVPLPASLVPHAAGRRSIFNVTRKGLIAMLGTIGMTLLGLVLLQATEAPDISGQWTSDEWGTVVLESKEPGHYEGTFSGVSKDKPATDNVTPGRASSIFGGGGSAGLPGSSKGQAGKLHLKWSRVECRFNGTWGTGDDRSGKMSLRLVDKEIRGAWTTGKAAQVESGTPRLGDLLWTRSREANDPAITNVRYDVSELIGGATNEQADSELKQLCSLIVETIEPNSWKEGEFRIGIAPYTGNSSIVVRQTGARHAAIRDLLKQLRELKHRESGTPRLADLLRTRIREANGLEAAVPLVVRSYAIQDFPLWSQDGTSQHIDLLTLYLEARVDSTKNGGDKIGTYDAGRGMLVVRGDARKHEQIAQIFTDLRANSGSPAEEVAKDKAHSNSDLRANSAQSDEDLAMEKLVKTYSIADLPIWSKDRKKQHVDLLLSYLRLNVDPPSLESKVTRAAYNAEMLALVVQGTPEVHNGIKAALSRLRGQTNLYGDPNAPTSMVPSRESTRAEPAPGDEAKLPEVIQALTASIVTVTRIEPADGDPANKPVSHAGVVVDSRGYIVIPLLPSQSKLMQFAVRFADQQEVVGQMVASDESLKFGVLKIERPQPVTAISLAKSREARVFDRVILVPSPASKELRRGQVTSTTVVLGEEGSNKLIETDVTFPLSEYGSLLVSEAGEPLGISMACRADPKPESIVLPLINVLHLITAAIDKPKDVPLVTVPASPPAIDLHKPVQITLQPVPPLAKSLVELFAPRGAKVLEYEEGKRLKIEAPPLVLEELGKLLELVGRGSTNVYDVERIQEAKAVSPPQLFGAKTPAGVLTYDGNVQEWVGGDRSGTVLPDGASKPVPNATIHLYRVSPIAKGGSGYQFEEIEVFKSDKQGHFKINIPDNLKRFIPTPGTIEWDDWESVLLITTSAPGFATDSTTLAANRSLDSIELIRGTSIRGRLVDEHEKPIVGAHVTVNAQSRATSREEMDEWLRQTSKAPLPKATFDPADTDALLTARKPASIANHDVQWIPTQIEGVVTDQEGRFTIDGIGPDDVLDLNVECFGYNNARIKVIGRYIETVYSRDPFASGENIAVHGRTLQATLIASDRGSPHSRHRVIKGERQKGQVEANASAPSAKEESVAPILPR